MSLYSAITTARSETDRLRALLRHACDELEALEKPSPPLISAVQKLAAQFAEAEKAEAGGMDTTRTPREAAAHLTDPDRVGAYLLLLGCGAADVQRIRDDIHRTREAAALREAAEGAPVHYATGKEDRP